MNIILLKSFAVRRRPLRFHIIVTNPKNLAAKTKIIKTTKQRRKKRLKKNVKGTKERNEGWKRRGEVKNKDGRKKMRQERGKEEKTGKKN